MKTMLKRSTKKYIWFFVFILPALVGFFIFTAYPVFRSLYLSFTNMKLVAPDEIQWVGLKNYIALFSGKDPFFSQALSNTVIYAVCNIVGTMALGLLSAMLLNVRVKGQNIFRTIFYIPSLLPAVATAIMFRWVFDPTNGIINTILRMLGVADPPIWLESASTALLTLIIISLYAFGGKMIIFLTGLNGINRSYYEAAEIDGAGYWRKFASITLPLLSPVIFYNALMGTIGALQVFTEGFVVAGAGPGNSTLFYVLRLYNLAYQSPYNLGQASAMAWILFVIIGIITAAYFIFSKHFVFYENEGK